MRTLALAATLLLLVGCGAEDDASQGSSSSKSSSKPAPPKNQRYSTVVELKDAAVKQGGFVCRRWRQDDAVTLAAESGECGGDDVFATFSSEGNLQEQLETYQGLDEMLAEVKMKPTPRLIGPNWIISSKRAKILASSLGGTVESP